MPTTQSLAASFHQAQPEEAGPRLILFAFRQMGAHGLDDACTAHSFMTAFGKDFRRPLVLLRTLMMELSAASTGPIQIAPWCCARMTAAEAGILNVLERCQTNPSVAALLLADMLGTRDARGPLATATALAVAFHDLGLPLGMPEV
ncbi:DUF6628 family protein [Sphingomonas sp.]|uniref:DUF6628 family protein n=1 Tax=Sphingomonas sp. TaxID=28214 RepID=UPI002BDDE00A|nr:DUF6628 family protein [Sphingomonas sp.]HWK35655.1 DUF6628 family protein [Sphingomonas sp.]